MQELLAVMTITVLAVISPGADFAMVTRASWQHGRRAGLWAALGIAAGVQVHVFYTLVGVGLLMTRLPWLFSAVKWVGAGYLIYIGWRTLRDRSPVADATQESKPGGTAQEAHSHWRAFRTGFHQYVESEDDPVCRQHVHAGGARRHGLESGAGLRSVHVARALGLVQPCGAGLLRRVDACGHGSPSARRSPHDRRRVDGAGGLLALANR